MNVQQTSFRNRVAGATDSPHPLLDHGASFQERTANIAAIAAADADEVDREGRFPKPAIDAARERKLLGA